MSEGIWLARRGESLGSTDRESAKLIAELGEGELEYFEHVGVRDKVAFRRYWVMCTKIAANVRQIEIDRVNRQPVYMRIFDCVNVSNAIKLGIGFYTEMPVGSTEYAIRTVDSIAWDKLSPAKWKKFILKAAPFVVKKILPYVEDPNAKDEISKLLNKWLWEAEKEGAQEQAA